MRPPLFLRSSFYGQNYYKVSIPCRRFLCQVFAAGRRLPKKGGRCILEQEIKISHSLARRRRAEGDIAMKIKRQRPCPGAAGPRRPRRSGPPRRSKPPRAAKAARFTGSRWLFSRCCSSSAPHCLAAACGRTTRSAPILPTLKPSSNRRPRRRTTAPKATTPPALPRWSRATRISSAGSASTPPT